MGLRQCNRCTRFFDPSDSRNPCWCPPQAAPTDTFVERAAAFFASCYNSVVPGRSEVLVSFVVAYVDGLEAEQRYAVLDEAARVADAEEVRVIVQQSLPKLAAMISLPLIIDDETSRGTGISVQPQDPGEAQQWLQSTLLIFPATLMVMLENWFRDLGFPPEFCRNLTPGYSIELAEWILGARRG